MALLRNFVFGIQTTLCISTRPPKTNHQSQSPADRSLGIRFCLVRSHDGRLPDGLYYAEKLSRWAERVSQRSILDPGQSCLYDLGRVRQLDDGVPVGETASAERMIREDDSHTRDYTVATPTAPHPMPTPPSIMIRYTSHRQFLHLSHSALLRPRVRHLFACAQPRRTVARLPAPYRQPSRT